MLLQSSGVLLARRLYRLLTIRIVIPRNGNRRALVAVVVCYGVEGFVSEYRYYPSCGCVAAYIYGASVFVVCAPQIGKIP